MGREAKTEAPVTRLLGQWAAGDRGALEELMPLVYDELRRLAGRQLARESAALTLEPAALVHEAWLRLAANPPGSWENREHFYAIAARLIRQVLVDHARGKQRDKRRHKAVTLTFDPAVEAPDMDLVRLDDALEGLAKVDEQQAKVVELRFFAGLSIAETAAALGVSTRTVNRDWMVARAWLYREMQGWTGKE
jgi:RNA polymerase sigma factor (TIGR02999 family)